MKYYAVIDTNVLVSAALKWKSVPGSIVDLAFNEVIVPLVNKEILEEYRSVLLRPEFHLTEEIVQDIIDEFVSHALDISEEETCVCRFLFGYQHTQVLLFSFHAHKIFAGAFFILPDT